MINNTIGDKMIYLHPGELCFSNKGVVVTTILGSCVAITMHNKYVGLGMISHCMLPYCKNGLKGCDSCPDIFKYVDCTILRMIEKFNSIGIKKEDIEIKIFGGADVLKNQNKLSNTQSVGAQNIKAALNTLEKFNLKVISYDTGGQKGRRIFFHTDTGDVYIKKSREYAEDQSINR